MTDKQRECPYFSEDHDMGATVPLCGKTGEICDDCCPDTHMSAVQHIITNMWCNLMYQEIGKHQEEYQKLSKSLTAPPVPAYSLPQPNVMKCECMSNCNKSNYKTDCYWYHKEQIMGAHIPTYMKDGFLGLCPCDDCKDYVTRKQIQEMLKTHCYCKNENETE